EQNPQTTATRRWPVPRQEIAHTMFVLPTMRDRAKRSMRRRGGRAPTERLGVRATETGVVAARRFPRRPSRRDAQGRNDPSLHQTDRRTADRLDPGQRTFPNYRL